MSEQGPRTAIPGRYLTTAVEQAYAAGRSDRDAEFATLTAERDALREALDRVVKDWHELAARVEAARFVGKAWITDILASEALRPTGMSHPVSMVLGALDGETDPLQVGLSAQWHDEFRALAAPSVADPTPEGET